MKPSASHSYLPRTLHFRTGFVDLLRHRVSNKSWRLRVPQVLDHLHAGIQRGNFQPLEAGLPGCADERHTGVKPIDAAALRRASGHDGERSHGRRVLTTCRDVAVEACYH